MAPVMPPIDRQDAEHVEQTCRTRGWELVRERIESMAIQAGGELEEAPLDKVPRLQERIAILRRVLELPQILMAEAKGGANAAGKVS